jgi:hypothetical protein
MRVAFACWIANRPVHLPAAPSTLPPVTIQPASLHSRPASLHSKPARNPVNPPARFPSLPPATQIYSPAAPSTFPLPSSPTTSQHLYCGFGEAKADTVLRDLCAGMTGPTARCFARPLHLPTPSSNFPPSHPPPPGPPPTSKFPPQPSPASCMPRIGKTRIIGSMHMIKPTCRNIARRIGSNPLAKHAAARPH